MRSISVVGCGNTTWGLLGTRDIKHVRAKSSEKVHHAACEPSRVSCENKCRAWEDLIALQVIIRRAGSRRDCIIKGQRRALNARPARSTIARETAVRHLPLFFLNLQAIIIDCDRISNEEHVTTIEIFFFAISWI